MVYITRRERFNAAHKLSNPAWDQATNEKIFGKCSNPNWHGHNYDLFITVKGEIDQERGWVIDLKDLSDLVNKKIINELDHKNLNLDVPFMKDKWASTEVLAFEIWNILAPEIVKMGAQLHCIKLMETENNYAEYYGE